MQDSTSGEKTTDFESNQIRSETTYVSENEDTNKGKVSLIQQAPVEATVEPNEVEMADDPAAESVAAEPSSEINEQSAACEQNESDDFKK